MDSPREERDEGFSGNEVGIMGGGSDGFGGLTHDGITELLTFAINTDVEGSTSEEYEGQDGGGYRFDGPSTLDSMIDIGMGRHIFSCWGIEEVRRLVVGG